MSKNLNRTRNAQLVIPAPVPAGTVAGSVIVLGANALTAYTLTPQVTAADLADTSSTTTPQGLAAGEASVELIGISTSVNLTMAVAVAQFDRIYRVRADGTYTNAPNTGGTTPITNDPVGFALAAAAAGAVVPVGLTRS